MCVMSDHFYMKRFVLLLVSASSEFEKCRSAHDLQFVQSAAGKLLRNSAAQITKCFATTDTWNVNFLKV